MNDLNDIKAMFNTSVFSELFNTYPTSADNSDAAEKLRKMLEDMSMDMPSPYELAEIEMNKQLAEKGFPSMKVLLDALEQTNPEYFL